MKFADPAQCLKLCLIEGLPQGGEHGAAAVSLSASACVKVDLERVPSDSTGVTAYAFFSRTSVVWSFVETFETAAAGSIERARAMSMNSTTSSRRSPVS